MNRFRLWVLAGIVASALPLPAIAAVVVHSIGAAIEKNGLKIEPHYLTGVEMGGMQMSGMETDEVHLEADVHAIKGEAHGFPEGAWMPYLTIKYTLTKDGTSFKATGTLAAMTAKLGPHYANDVQMSGPGTYQLTYDISPPSPETMKLHTEPDIGVQPWWKPFSLHWSFIYPTL